MNWTNTNGEPDAENGTVEYCNWSHTYWIRCAMASWVGLVTLEMLTINAMLSSLRYCLKGFMSPFIKYLLYVSVPSMWVVNFNTYVLHVHWKLIQHYVKPIVMYHSMWPNNTLNPFLLHLSTHYVELRTHGVLETHSVDSPYESDHAGNMQCNPTSL